ncbi:MAG: hypothetical protein ACOX7R_11455 [Acetivibrionales bacterium]
MGCRSPSSLVRSNYRLLTGEAEMRYQEHKGLPRTAKPPALRQDADSLAHALQRAKSNTACLRRTGCGHLYLHA